MIAVHSSKAAVASNAIYKLSVNTTESQVQYSGERGLPKMVTIQWAGVLCAIEEG